MLTKIHLKFIYLFLCFYLFIFMYLFYFIYLFIYIEIFLCIYVKSDTFKAFIHPFAVEMYMITCLLHALHAFQQHNL